MDLGLEYIEFGGCKLIHTSRCERSLTLPNIWYNWSTTNRLVSVATKNEKIGTTFEKSFINIIYFLSRGQQDEEKEHCILSGWLCIGWAIYRNDDSLRRVDPYFPFLLYT